MFGNIRQSSPFDGILIDDCNERPLAVALATIIMVWSLAFALTLASGRTGANSASWLSGDAAVSFPALGLFVGQRLRQLDDIRAQLGVALAPLDAVTAVMRNP